MSGRPSRLIRECLPAVFDGVGDNEVYTSHILHWDGAGVKGHHCLSTLAFRTSKFSWSFVFLQHGYFVQQGICSTSIIAIMPYSNECSGKPIRRSLKTMGRCSPMFAQLCLGGQSAGFTTPSSHRLKHKKELLISVDSQSTEDWLLWLVHPYIHAI